MTDSAAATDARPGDGIAAWLAEYGG